MPRRATKRQLCDSPGPRIRLRLSDENECELPFFDVRIEHILQSKPWRTVRSYRRQRHISGLYHATTTGAHVQYESRNELARLIMADFDPAVVNIAAQPFLLIESNSRRDRRHIPDFFFVLSDGTEQIVNVKTKEQLAIPKVKATLEWAHATFATKGWRTEIWTGENPVVLSNLRFLAAYRRRWLFDDRALNIVRHEVDDNYTIHKAEARLRSLGIADPRPLILHLVWHGAFRVDLTRALDLSTRLERAS